MDVLGMPHVFIALSTEFSKIRYELRYFVDLSKKTGERMNACKF